MEIYKGLPQAEFYKIAADCHLFLSAIDELQSPNAMYEQTYLGQIGILPDCDWARNFFPDYQYWHNFSEAFMFIKEFSENPEPFIEKNLKFRQWLRENYDIYTNARSVLKLIKERIKDRFVYDKAVEITKEVLESVGYPQQFTYEELKEFFKNNTKTGVSLEKPTFRRLNKFDFIKAVFTLGYEDTCELNLTFKKTVKGE